LGCRIFARYKYAVRLAYFHTLYRYFLCGYLMDKKTHKCQLLEIFLNDLNTPGV
jgi:hypothetical protein